MSKLLGTEHLSKKAPKVKAIKPLGQLVLVELLTKEETTHTNLQLVQTKASIDTTNEAYVIELGELVPKEYGLKQGQRVFISGGIVFCPDHGNYRYSDDGRKRGTVEYMCIKGVAEEE